MAYFMVRFGSGICSNARNFHCDREEMVEQTCRFLYHMSATTELQNIRCITV